MKIVNVKVIIKEGLVLIDCAILLGHRSYLDGEERISNRYLAVGLLVVFH